MLLPQRPPKSLGLLIPRADVFQKKIQDIFQNFWVLTLLKLSSVLMALTDSESCAGLHAECNIAGSADLNRLISQLTANSRSPTYLLVQNTGSVTMNGEPPMTLALLDTRQWTLSVGEQQKSIPKQLVIFVNSAQKHCGPVKVSSLCSHLVKIASPNVSPSFVYGLQNGIQGVVPHKHCMVTYAERRHGNDIVYTA
ncbi:unnamed protein product [Schistocephalus solidus]|uniref:Secreted protein n=1 Tax=Schistocephalus solidus TaxID=70667 RepID=A0A183SUZ5_SCHSO|nr:unnamed protein product [Schistocephalus solidus]